MATLERGWAEGGEESVWGGGGCGTLCVACVVNGHRTSCCWGRALSKFSIEEQARRKGGRGEGTQANGFYNVLHTHM